MKKIIAMTLFAVVTVTGAADAFAQTAGGGNGRGGPDGNGSSILDALNQNCIPGAATHACRPRYKVRIESDGCECKVRKVRVGDSISFVKDCYYFDQELDTHRYCQPWERNGL